MSEKRVSDEEKGGVVQHEHSDPTLLNSTDRDSNLSYFTEAEQKRIIRRVDVRLVVTLGVLYCISLIDRGNLGVAVIAGMKQNLKMDAENNAYSIISLVFFIPYIVFQPPATVLIRKIGPRNFLAAIVLAWGVVMIGFGFAPTWQTLAVLRTLLGAFEAGFYPGCVYLLSVWYPRYELQKRNAAFFTIGSISSCFGAIFAYGLIQMHGLAGYEGWRWLFIMQGILTCLLGIGSYFLIVDFPEKAAQSWGFLNQKEVDFVIAGINADRADTDIVPFNFRQYLACAADLKIWAMSFMFMLTTTNTYALAYFTPTILSAGMGFTISVTLCVAGTPAIFACIYVMIQAYYADKWHLRGPIIAVNCIVGAVGTALLGYTKTPGIRFFGIFLAAAGCSANCPAILTYQANNIRGQWKRALASATLIGGGAVGGIVGTTVFREADAPNYGPGIIACLIAYALTFILTGLLTLKFWRANKRAAAGGKVIEGLEGFRYTY